MQSIIPAPVICLSLFTSCAVIAIVTYILILNIDFVFIRIIRKPTLACLIVRV
ncbi:hypothetical protein C900_00091 [Fulvivirga imtechensis AK7]|uniref:Uncharacterized protein n=1 Tax=Fulvivirga imtechensis AK7 TaxID=1237149 RepID=L8JVD8_9BACT|nr:hypothetical protein C900_00091 [Fulvivirga imtechensis AK7]